MPLIEVIKAYRKLVKVDAGHAGRWLDSIGVHPVIRRSIVAEHRTFLG